MGMTKQEAIENHRKLWKWIAIETMKRKRVVTKPEYFIANNIEPVKNLCYCCEYAEQKSSDSWFADCNFCPIDWGTYKEQYDEIKYMSCCDNSLYERWKNLKDYPKRNHDYRDYKRIAFLAYKISKLPEREYFRNLL